MKRHKLTAAMLALICILSASSLAGCSKTGQAPAQTELKSVADHLYEISYTEDFNWGEDTVLATAGFACSGIQVGQYRGRNYDWYYDNTDICVIHASATENREHASVGVADLSFLADGSGTYDLEKLPFYTVDGINDAGVCVQVNVMPMGENGELTHTDSSLDDLPGEKVVRYLLDYADNVEEAISLLTAKDLYTIILDEELHWMISGPASELDSTTKTVVAEFFPNGLHITENFQEDIPVMTNFNVSNFDGTAKSVGWGCGYERWQILCENYAQASSVMGTFDLMEKVFYSKMYDLYSDRFWYSEYALVDLCGYYEEAELKSLLGEENYNYFVNNYGAVYYVPALWDGERSLAGNIDRAGIIAPVVRKVADRYNAKSMGYELWITVETSVYDLENLTLDLAVRESQDHYHFEIE